MINIFPKILTLGALVGLATASISVAAIYRYVDIDGMIHFTNVPPSNKYHYYAGERNDSNPANMSQLDSLIEMNARRFSLDGALIMAVIKVESDFDPATISHRGAQGLMQLMPDTAREVGVDNPFDPSESISGGSMYLRRMLDSFDSNLDYALAAYNAGPTAVRKYGGIPPYQETQNYVKKVKQYIEYYRRSKDTL
jgi:soluble lytic murein transglycosylase